MNNNKTRGISGLSILLCVLVLAGVYWFMSQSGVQQTAYTYQDFQKDLKKEKVESVEVKQNKVAPTGTLKIRLKNDDIEQLHVSDVNSAEDLLEVIKRIDAGESSGIRYSKYDLSPRFEPPEWDYRKYNIESDNALFKGEIDLIREAYESC